MQKKCRRCGDTFKVTTHEDYCPECEKVMTPPGEGVSKEITCESCGKTFIHRKEKAQGRWPKYCPTCAPAFSKTSKKDTTKIEEVPDDNTEETYIEDSKTLTVYTPTIKRVAEQSDRIEHDAVNHPSHYTRGKIEVIDFIEDQQLPYHLGNVVKYVARAGYKGDKLEDLKKARWYLDRYINEVMGNETL
nr:MAG TPA: nucelotide kinase [Caudoviricetes sp.]